MLIGLLAAAPAAAQFRCLETRDLRLVYHGPTLSFIAPHTARCFENSLRFYRGLFGYVPSEKVNVILDDSADFGNAGVWATPRNSMSIQIAPANFVYETGPGNERINFAMNHEVGHIVVQDQAAGSDRFFRRLFHGKVRETSEHPESIVYSYLTLPRRAGPRWYHEGIAVFLETWMSGGLGRAQGPYDEMVFRAMVRDSTRIYDPLGLESEGTKIDFQVGVNSYLYGTRFMTYMAYRDSPRRLLEWVSRTPGSRQYFAAQFRHVYGQSLESAWRDWIAWERGFQRANLDSIRRYPTTAWRDLSPEALGSVSRAHLDRAARTLHVAVDHPGKVAHLAAIPLDGGPSRNLREVKGPALYFVCSLARDPGTGVLYYTTDNGEWRDLCSLDPATGAARTLIRDARIGDLAFDRHDGSLWGVRHFNGISTLVRLPPPYQDWNQIYSFPYGRDIYDLDVSPDGRWISASMGEISGRHSLRLWPLEALARGDTTSRVAHDFGSAIPSGFVFSDDGRHLFGSSYYTGVSNIWRYDVDRDSMDIVTNAETGFFRPIPLGGDSMIVFRYTGEGFVPSTIVAKPLTDVSAITFLGQQLVAKHPELESWRVPSPATVHLDSLTVYSGDYRPLSQFALTTVYPVMQVYKEQASFGAQLSFSDPIGFHSVDLAVTHTPGARVPADERWHGTLGYRRHPLTLKLRYNPASFYDLVGPTKISRKGYGASLQYTRTLVRDAPRTVELTATLGGHGGLERLPDFQNVSTSAGFDKLVTGSLELGGKNLRSSIGAADREKGYQWRLIASTQGVRFVRAGRSSWSNFPQGIATLDLGTPLPIRNASLWLRTAGGVASGARDEPFANFFFGGFGNNWIDHQEPKRYREVTSFPGAELNAVAGTNFARVMLDWNLPPLRFRRAGTLALHATWARTSLFASGLVTNLDRADLQSRVADVGIQTDVRFALLARQSLTLSFGYARAWERRRLLGDEWMVSLKIL